jgi:beta-lactamase superfamily II metal-dependent hydrolase
MGGWPIVKCTSVYAISRQFDISNNFASSSALIRVDLPDVYSALVRVQADQSGGHHWAPSLDGGLMASITFYPLGNADTFRIDLDGGEKLLFDYANTRCADKEDDKRADLPAELRRDLKAAKRDSFDVVAFTHLDDDHTCGAPAFFELWHAEKYQGGDRIKLPMMWVPAQAITESKTELCSDAKIIQQEARHRLKKGKGIRVFSRPDALKDWLEQNGLTIADRKDLITDAGTCVPGWTKEKQGVEFFVHSPFATHQDSGKFEDRNSNSLVFQAVFLVDDTETKALLMADTEYECMQEIVKTTKGHKREERLEWDLAKLPHHCSYGSLGPDKGKDKTKPVEEVAWLYEAQGRERARIISPSCPIVNEDTKQPPHFQAAAYYKEILAKKKGEFLVTMESPSESNPAPLVIEIGKDGASVRKAAFGGAAVIVSRPAPRAGRAS